VRAPPSTPDHQLSLTLDPLATRHFASCGVQPWHLPFTKPQEAMLAFPLAFSLLVTSQVEGLNSHSLISRIPETREVNGCRLLSLGDTCSPIYRTGPPCGSTMCPSSPTLALRDFASRSATSFVSRHLKCRDPKLLITPYRNTRLRGFRDKSLNLLSIDMLKCQNSDTSSMQVPQQNFSPFWSFELCDFTNPDAKLLVLQPTKPRNTEFRCTSPITGSHKSLLPSGTSPFAAS
jgi:hypothetical protein